MEEFFKITVLPESKKSRVEEREGRFFVSVRAKKEGGAANREALALLAELLGVSPGRLAIVKGARTPNKIVKVAGARGKM